MAAPDSPDDARDSPAVVAASDGLRVLADYPGANVTDVAVDGDTVRANRDTRDSGSEWTFWWSFGLESDRDREVTVRFPDELVGRFGPAVGPGPATDEPRTWSWLGAGSTPDGERFRYEFEAGERVFFATSFPYLRADFEWFWAVVGDHPAAQRTELTTSELGRPVPLLRLGSPDADQHCLLTARHHASEAPGSYALEGTVRALLDSGPLSDRCVHVVPFVDVDGVQRGDQGKERLPHDHNRDYGTGNALLDDVVPIYAATAAIQDHVRGLDSEFAVALDYHAPYKWGSEQWGDLHDRAFFAGAREDASAAERRLADLLADETAGTDALDFDAAAGFGEPGGLPGGTSFAGFCERAGATLSTTIEVPYVGTPGNQVTPARLRGLGRALGRALLAW